MPLLTANAHRRALNQNKKSLSFGEKSIRCEKIFVSDIFNDHEEQSDNQSRQKSEMSGMWKSQKSEKWIRSCLLASLHHLIPGLTRKKEEKWEQRS